jgi:hypothetical protein
MSGNTIRFVQRRRFLSSRWSFAFWIVTCLAVATANAYAAGFRTVTLSGQPAPGTSVDTDFAFVSTPVLNDAGQTAFLAFLAGDDITIDNNHGIWLDTSGVLELVARAGNQAPGMPDGVNFGSFVGYPYVLNDTGTISFSASLSTFHSGIWSGRVGTLAPLAVSGDVAVGTSGGVTYQFVVGRVLNNMGQAAFSSFLVGPGITPDNYRGIWSEKSSGLTLVARTGNQAPGVPVGARFDSLGNPVLNDVGHVAFWGGLRGTVSTANENGIWADGPGGLALVAREGDPAPGTPRGVVFGGDVSVFSEPVINNTGQTAFVAGLIGIGVTSSNDLGIWSQGSGILALVARTGSHAPDTANGVNFGSFRDPVLNNEGQTVFEGSLVGTGVDDTNDAGIWLEQFGALKLIARKGSHAPGTPEGVTFGTYIPFLFPALNDAGQVAFRAFVTDGEIETPTEDGIWATDRTGALQLIVRKGDMLEVAPGDFRTIDGLGFQGESGNSDGRPSGLNNLGQIAFLANFTDGTSGVFVSNRVAVPEPSAVLLTAWAAPGLLRRRYYLRNVEKRALCIRRW